MKFSVNTRKVLLVAAVSLPIAFQLHAQQISPLVGPRPPKTGDERIVRSNVKGYLEVYTPETPVYDDEGPTGWNNDDYRIMPESGKPARTWFYRRPLALDPGIYVIETLNPGIDAVEPYPDGTYDERVRVLIKPGQITDVWLNDSDRPKFTSPAGLAFVRDVYGDIIGYRNR